MTVDGNLFVPLTGWGRNINHDPASRAYRVPRAAVPRDADWTPHISAMDQGNLGRCVPTAGTAMLACDPFIGTLRPELRKILLDPVLREVWAVQAYREVTALDPFLGAWEPDDTGSDGLSLAKLFQQRGLTNGYQHVMDIDGAHTAIQRGPFPIGISWLSGMDRPGIDGVVQVSGSMRGGHEVLVYRYDLARDLWWCRNSWSPAWGLRGDFAFDTPGYQKLMAMQADGTPMTPVTAPAPVPTPQPEPAIDTFPFVEMDLFASRRRAWWPKYQKAAADTYLDWRRGLR